MLITPQKKIQLMRQAEHSPGAALLAALDLLRAEMKSLIEEKISVIDKETIAKSAIEAVNYLKGVKGKDGFSPVKGQHYFTKTEQREFLRMATPQKGVDYLTEQEILAVRDFIVSKIRFPQDGHTPTLDELTSLIKPLIPEVKDGKTPTREELTVLVKSLIPKIESELSGEKILQKINALPLDLKFQIPASRILGLSKLKRDKYLHGGGDTVSAGTGISISTDSSGNKTISTSIGTFVENEIVAGSGTTFTLAGTPVSGSVKLYAARQRIYPTTDWTISGSTITTVLSWGAGDLIADYRR